MSYEPHIYIDVKQLEHQQSQIEADASNFPDDKVIQFIAELLDEKKYTRIHFPQMSFIRCQPELSSFNKKIRETLFYNYDIEYKEDIG